MAEQGDHDAVGERFVRRLLALRPGEQQPYVEAEWHDTLIVIARGELELRCHAGGRRRFRRGDILWTEGLGLRWLVNPGPTETVLVTVSRADARPTE